MDTDEDWTTQVMHFKSIVTWTALSSGKIDKYEYLTGEEIWPSNQSRMLEQAKFTYSPLGKVFEKKFKTNEDQREKEIKATEEHGKQLAESNALIKTWIQCQNVVLTKRFSEQVDIVTFQVFFSRILPRFEVLTFIKF